MCLHLDRKLHYFRTLPVSSTPSFVSSLYFAGKLFPSGVPFPDGFGQAPAEGQPPVEVLEILTRAALKEARRKVGAARYSSSSGEFRFGRSTTLLLL